MRNSHVLAAAVAVLLSACGVSVYPSQIEAARTLCDAHGGAKFVEISTTTRRAFIEAFCNDGVSIKATIRDPR